MYRKIKLLSLCFFMLATFTATAQTSSATSSKEEKFAKLESKMIYPLIKGSKMTGVLPVDNITNKPAAGTIIKLIFDFTQSTANDAQGTHVNEGLEEVARMINLHIAAGVKKENLSTVIIFHSGSIISILKNSYYQKEYSTANPNLDLLTQLKAAGATLVVCGQSLQFREVDQKDLLPMIQVAFSAKTTLSKYQQKGYIPVSVGEH